ncbi:MAG: hypothetical protein H7Z39_06500 [Burkholderiaceae bacterium]|nr:hypothetical protein [Burkholderiaceae bacterium]
MSYTREARILRGFGCGWQIFSAPAARGKRSAASVGGETGATPLPRAALIPSHN